MSREHLGMFDTPPGPREVKFVLAITGVLLAACLAVLPVANVRVAEITPFVPVVDAVVALGELIIATMLYAQAAIFRSQALTVLASGFVLIALLLVGHALTSPGAFAPNGLLGAGRSTTAWLAIFRRTSFPVIIIVYVLLEQAEAAATAVERRPPPRVLLWVAGAVLLAATFTILGVKGDGLLPPMFVNRAEINPVNLAVAIGANIVLGAIGMVMLLLKRKSVLDIWLMVALAGFLIQSLLNIEVHARFTIGFYTLNLLILASHIAVLLALIGESNRLYARLALSAGAHNRERDARMMSMEAVAAAISHEVGQPLAAVTLSATASLSSLTRTPPNLDMAMESLRDVLDAGYRAFDVLKSMRTTFSHSAGSLSEFSLNHLVRETVSLLSRELAARRIVLRLDLEEPQHPVLANRIQIQRVLVNLVTNAIESFGPQARGASRSARPHPTARPCYSK